MASDEKPGILDTILKSYNFIWDNKEHAIKIFIPIFLWAFAIEVLVVPLMGSTESTSDLAKFLAGIGVMVLYTIFTTAIAISWHRAYLLGPDKAKVVNPFKMKRDEWQFLCKTLLYFALIIVGLMIAMIPVFTIMGFIKQGGAGTDSIPQIVFVAVVFLILLFVVMALSSRLSLYFPAKAVGDYISFRESFKLMKGHGLRLAWITILANLPFSIAISAYDALVKVMYKSVGFENEGLVANITDAFIRIPSNFILSWISVFVLVTLITHYYVWMRDNGKLAG